MESVLASITMLDTMITKFNIQNNVKVTSNDKSNVKFQFSVGLPVELDIKEEVNNFEIGLRVNVIVEEAESNRLVTNIESEIKGVFEVKSKDKEKILAMLKYNGIPLLFQELRAYITGVTAMSHNKEIILPMINFFNYFNEKEDNK